MRDAWRHLPGERRGYYSQAVLILNAARVIAWRNGNRRPGVALVYDGDLIERTGLPRSTYYETKKRIKEACELGLLPFRVELQNRRFRGDAQVTEWHLVAPAAPASTSPASGQASPDAGLSIRNENPLGGELKERAHHLGVAERAPPGSPESPGVAPKEIESEPEPEGERQPEPEVADFLARVAERIVDVEVKAASLVSSQGFEFEHAVAVACRVLNHAGFNPFELAEARRRILLDRVSRPGGIGKADRDVPGIETTPLPADGAPTAAANTEEAA